jgi:DNA invertase Pin-like site-specific DNA recombinase
MRAAAYVRMSSDRQDLSIGTQLASIEAYAREQALIVVAVYEDAAKSGLNIANRAGMKRLLRDVMDEPRPFDIVLVYDVSRWGRFQDIDASAYYEYTCRLHGVDVIYVEEVFGNVRDPMTALLKTMKRAMAAEYARELGVKTRAGQDRAISLGYQIGPMPCIGFRRVAVERNGQRRPLARGQYKSMQNERIAWEPGPETETNLVRHIFELYASEGGTIKGTTRQLQAQGLRNQSGQLFTMSMVDRVLRCEAFRGNFVWGKERYIAGKQERKRPPTRADNVIEPIVSQELWERVQRKLWSRRRLRRDKEELLQILREKLAECPTLNSLDLEALGLHSKRAYANAFGSVSRALELAGRDARLVRVQHERLKVKGRKIGDRLERDISKLLVKAGIPCRIHPRSRILVLGDSLRLRLQLMWPRTIRGENRWHLLKNRRPPADAMLLAQMDEGPVANAFILLRSHEFRATTPWFTRDLPEQLRPIRTASDLVRALSELASQAAY